jgi:hypothetical protein
MQSCAKRRYTQKCIWIRSLRCSRPIVAAMKQGAFFRSSDKEGDSRIAWIDGRFLRIRSGEDPGREMFASKEAFLKSLRMYYDFETPASSYPDKVSDLVAWKLILRLLRPKSQAISPIA